MIASLGHSFYSRRAVVLTVLILGFVALTSVMTDAGGLSQAPLFRSGTRVVSLFVTVFDAQRRLVPDLPKPDREG